MKKLAISWAIYCCNSISLIPKINGWIDVCATCARTYLVVNYVHDVLQINLCSIETIPHIDGDMAYFATTILAYAV